MCKTCYERPDCSSQPHCIELVTPVCDTGCANTNTTDCIFYNINNDDKSSVLAHIGVFKGTTLERIIRKINAKFGESVNTNFKPFNMNGLNSTKEITNIKEFVEAITYAVKVSNEYSTLLKDEMDELSAFISTVDNSFVTLNKPTLSSSKLNINSQDNIKEVLSKLVIYLNNLSTESIVPLNFTDSDTVTFSSSGAQVSAEVKLSREDGNRAILLEDGIYVTDPSITYILNAIKDNPELKVLFTALIGNNFPSFSFDIMSNSNQLITYINRLGVEVTVTAKTNNLLKLTDVRKIITVPTAGLSITFKGIN